MRDQKSLEKMSWPEPIAWPEPISCDTLQVPDRESIPEKAADPAPKPKNAPHDPIESAVDQARRALDKDPMDLFSEANEQVWCPYCGTVGTVPRGTLRRRLILSCPECATRFRAAKARPSVRDIVDPGSRNRVAQHRGRYGGR